MIIDSMTYNYEGIVYNVHLVDSNDPEWAEQQSSYVQVGNVVNIVFAIPAQQYARLLDHQFLYGNRRAGEAAPRGLFHDATV